MNDANFLKEGSEGLITEVTDDDVTILLTATGEKIHVSKELINPDFLCKELQGVMWNSSAFWAISCPEAN